MSNQIPHTPAPGNVVPMTPPAPPMRSPATPAAPQIPKLEDIAPPLDLRTASLLDGYPVPARPWLVYPLIPSQTVTLLGGDGGTGKSLLAAQLAASVSLGRFWLNKYTLRGPAIYLSAEDDADELHRRFVDIARQENVRLSDLKALHFLSLAGEDASLSTVEPKTGKLAPEALFYRLDKSMSILKPALVVLDTLADLFSGNENDRQQVRAFIGLLRKLAIKHRCAMVLLAHPSLSGLNSGSGLSGSTAWNNSVRSRLYFARVKTGDGYEANPDARVLQLLKSNYGRVGEDIGLTYRSGIFVPDASGTTDRDANAEGVFLRLLSELARQGRHVNASSGPYYAPKIMSEMPGASGCTKRTLKDAMEKLLACRKIAIRTIRENGKDRNILALTGEKDAI